MGVKGLYSYLKYYRTELDISGSQPLRVGIDAMSILYRYKGDVPTILSLLGKLRDAGHCLFFVFDGKPPVEKEVEIQHRKDTKASAAAQASVLETFLQSSDATNMDPSERQVLLTSLERYQRQSWHMTRDTRRAFQDELWKVGIPYVKSLSEADDVLIDLCAGGKLDVVLSSDMDYLLGGVPRLWIPCRRGDYMLEEICLEEVLKGEELTQEKLTDIGLLCGTDEQRSGVPCHTAFTWIRFYGSIEALKKSKVGDVACKMFPSEEELARLRQARMAKGVYERIRPDHLERVKEFLDTL
jgi:flap endonuclease-1